MEHTIDHLTLGNFLWVATGLLLLILTDLRRAMKKHNSSFSFATYARKNVIQSLIAMIGSYTMFYHADSFTNGMLEVHVHEHSNYYAWFAIACGFNGHVLVDRLDKQFK